MSDFYDDFTGAAGSLLGRTTDGQTWYDPVGGGAWTLDGAGLAVGNTGVAAIPLTDDRLEFKVTAKPGSGVLHFGLSTDFSIFYQAYEGYWGEIDAATSQVYIKSTYSDSPAVGLPALPWTIRVESDVDDPDIRVYCNNVLVLDYTGSWSGSGPSPASFAFFSGAGFKLDYVSLGTPPAPPAEAFWTDFVNTYENI